MAPRGQDLFLANTSMLQHTLLRHLSAADMLRLGLSCKDLYSWVLAAPLRHWQARKLTRWSLSKTLSAVPKF